MDENTPPWSAPAERAATALFFPLHLANPKAVSPDSAGLPPHSTCVEPLARSQLNIIRHERKIVVFIVALLG
jgi:hypothetical protein